MSDILMENESQEGVKSSNKRRWVITAVIVLVALLSVGGYWGWQKYQSYMADARKAEIQAEAIARIEDQWGIRITRVALVAEGGLVDMRYQVTDPDKAIYMFDAVENIPRVIANNGTELAMNDDPHTHDLEFGLSYFFLLRNIDNAVQPGDQVTLAVGDLRLPYYQIAR